MKNRYQICQKVFLLMAVLFSYTAAVAQEIKISGKVTDEKYSEGLPGVTVKVKGTLNNGTVTDFNGNYSLTVENGEVTLQFSSVGYATKEIALNGRTTLDVIMSEDVKQLNEVVVVGYGTQTKRELTGSVAKVGAEKLKDIPTPSFESALQGKAAGVQVVQGSGVAGSGAVVRIRGIASVSAGGDPLYVVDGVPITQDNFMRGNSGAMNNNPLATINPNDIESVEILKDAGAAGIYGSRGANGVILITTKRGKNGKPSFNFSSKVGISTPANQPNMLGTPQYLQLLQEAWENDGNTGAAPVPGYGVSEGSTSEQRLQAMQAAQQVNTDWWNQLTEPGLKQEYNFSMSQGNEKLKSYFGASYSDNGSYLKQNSYERMSVRGNVDYAVAPSFLVKLSSSFSRGLNHRVNTGHAGGVGRVMSTALPVYPVRNEAGEWFTGGGAHNNPVMQLQLTDWKNHELRTINNLSLEWEPVKSLIFRSKTGFDYMDLKEDIYKPQELINTQHVGEAKRYSVWNRNLTQSLTATYEFSPADDHKFTLLAGSEYQTSISGGYDRTVNDATQSLYYGYDIAGTTVLDEESGENIGLASDNTYNNANSQWAFLGYFGRINYGYKNRYIFQALARVDGSSRFGRNNRYGFFPSVSGAWIISEENFLKDNSLVSLLKLRSSYGISGNANIGDYDRFGTYSPPGNNTMYNNQNTIYPIRLPNPDLKWENLYSFDAAVEFGLFDDRISGEVLFYNKLSKDILINRNSSASSGFGSSWENVGDVLNRGLELSLSTVNVDGAFRWTTEFNIAKNHNEVLSLGDLTPDAVGGGTNDTRVVVGHPIGANYLVRYHGVDPEDGLPIWLDKEGYQTKEFSLDNRVVVGSVVPDYTGGLSNNFSYKGFDLTVFLTYTIGGNLYDGSAKRQNGVVTDWNFRSDLLDRWTQPGDQAYYPRLTRNLYPGLPRDWDYNSTMFLYDASFLRVRNVSLAYTFPSSMLQSVGLKGAKVYVSASNLLTFTKYPGGDPEIARDFENPQDRNMSPNVTYLTAPQERAFTFGVNVNF